LAVTLFFFLLIFAKFRKKIVIIFGAEKADARPLQNSTIFRCISRCPKKSQPDASAAATTTAKTKMNSTTAHHTAGEKETQAKPASL
jgi:hypothetical protein